MTIISADQTLQLSAIILLFVAAAIAAERTRIGGMITAPAILLIGGAACSNLGLIPLEAPLYGVVVAYLVPAAIPLLLFKADLRRIISETGTLAPIFLAAALFAVIGALLATLFVDLGPDEGKMAGTLAATFIGGSLNFVAVSSALEFQDPSLIASALAADNALGAGFLVILAATSGTAWFLRRVQLPKNTEEPTPEPETQPDHTGKPGLLFDLSLALALSATVVAVAAVTAIALDLARYSILLVTVLSVVVANIAPRHMARLRGDYELGTLLMFLFFFVIGASTDFIAFITSAAGVVLFTIIIMGTQIVSMTLLAWTLKLDFADVAIALNACIAGPATAAALAASRGWPHLVTPGLMCGIGGYVLANFVGVWLARLLSG